MWAQSEEIIEVNPFPFHEFKKPPLPPPDFITPEQFMLIVNTPGLTLRELTALWLLWETGIRADECAQLDQGEIQFHEDGGTVFIPQHKSKGGYSIRYVPFGEITATLLKMQIEYVKQYTQDPCILLNERHKRLDAKKLWDLLRRIGLKTSPIRGTVRLSPHMLRHSFGIRKLEEGVPELIVSKWLGHANLAMTAHYTNMTRESSVRLHKRYDKRKILQEA